LSAASSASKSISPPLPSSINRYPNIQNSFHHPALRQRKEGKDRWQIIPEKKS
jgi:hypothetical protein